MRKVGSCGCDSSRHGPQISPFKTFRNHRIDLIDVKGSRELNAFLGNALIGQVVAA